MSVPPTIGRIVHYRLSEQDVEQIEEYRSAAPGRKGNSVRSGDVYPAVVVRTFGDTLGVNLQVLLDADHPLWATSRGYSTQTEGCWFWLPRLDMTMEGR